MLYVSTRNSADTYTAYRALHEEHTPDGGFYVPFHLPAFTEETLSALKKQSFSDTVAQVLNLLFGLRLSGWDVEFAIGRNCIRSVSTNQRILFAECWHNPDGNFSHVVNRLYNLTTGENFIPAGWFCIAVRIAVLFGLYAGMDDTPEFDVAVTAGDFADVAAAMYAKDMGLPINTVICACDENSSAWDFINKGEWNTAAAPANVTCPAYLEYFIARKLNTAEVCKYLDCCNRKATYFIDEEQLEAIKDSLYICVVSTRRVDTIISGMYSSNQYRFDPCAASSYGALQDYRSSVGVNHFTVIPATQRPAKAKE